MLLTVACYCGWNPPSFSPYERFSHLSVDESPAASASGQRHNFARPCASGSDSPNVFMIGPSNPPDNSALAVDQCS